METFFLIVALSIISSTGLGFLYYAHRRAFYKDERKRKQWQNIPFLRDKRYISGGYSFWGGSKTASVEGFYQGHRLRIDSFYRAEPDEKNHIYTRFILSVIKISPLQEPLPQPHIIALMQEENEVDLQEAGQEICYEQQGLETDIKKIEALLVRLSKISHQYAQIIAMGGEVAYHLSQLQAPDLQKKAIPLLQGIARETTEQVAPQAEQLFCPHCLTRSGPHSVSWQDSIIYYGCRICHQSRDLLKVQVVAVIDQNMESDRREQGDRLYINWLRQRTLFDFDEVLIRQATDEQVERFAVQVGNDTDPYRKSRYPHIVCHLSSSPTLTENTLRILRQMFKILQSQKNP